MPHQRPPKHSLHSRAQNKAKAQLAGGYRLERWHRWSLYASGWILLGSGILWLIARYFLRVTTEFGDSIHPLEHVAMQMHGVGALASCFFVGSLLQQHIRRAYRAHKNLGSAWVLISVLSALVLSGYALYYWVGEQTRPLISTTHWVVGLALPVVLMVHIVLGRRALRK